MSARDSPAVAIEVRPFRGFRGTWRPVLYGESYVECRSLLVMVCQKERKASPSEAMLGTDLDGRLAMEGGKE
jgi:hypothetical protein